VEGAKKSWQWWKDNVLPGIDAIGPIVGGGGVLGFVIIASAMVTALPVTIFGGLGGAIYGAFIPPSSPEYPAYVENLETIYQDTLATYPIQETFQSSFLKEARARTSHTFVVVPAEGSQTAEGMVGQGVDTLLELSVHRIWLKRAEDREGDINPPVVLTLFVRARLVRGTEKTVWYDQTFFHETAKRLYVSWYTGFYYSPRFRADIEEAYQNLAEQMVNELFFTTHS
jgi:hypothetical protein